MNVTGTVLQGSNEVTTGGRVVLHCIEDINCILAFGKWQKKPSRFRENFLTANFRAKMCLIETTI